MELKKMFSPVPNISADDARRYAEDHAEGSYVLLDVRQPLEYKQSHIPGAKLIPLPELFDRVGELDPKKPVIAYCAAGGRSRVAAQYLSGQGFETIYNLYGGMMAWEGLEAAGPMDFGMTVLKGDESLFRIIEIAYAQEQGLSVFYGRMASLVTDTDTAGVFDMLADIEEKHKRNLWDLYESLDPSADRESFEKRISSEIMEGGWNIEDFVKEHRDSVGNATDAINIAMMIEAQAFDLYSRYSHKSKNDKVIKVLSELADEEKAHLKRLGRLMDEKQPQP